MIQVSIGVAAGLFLTACLIHTMPAETATAVKPSPMTGSPFEVASDGVNATLPSTSMAPTASFGTAIAGAGPMPSVNSFTHTMYDN